MPIISRVNSWVCQSNIIQVFPWRWWSLCVIAFHQPTRLNYSLAYLQSSPCNVLTKVIYPIRSLYLKILIPSILRWINTSTSWRKNLESDPRNSYMFFYAVMDIFCNYQCLTYLYFGCPEYLIEATSSNHLIILSQGQILSSIIIVSDSSLPSGVNILLLIIRDNKIMFIQIYLPTLHSINLFGLSWFTLVVWHNLQHQECEISIAFFHSLQRTNLVLFNGF